MDAKIQLLLKGIREQLQANKPVPAFQLLEDLKAYLQICTITPPPSKKEETK